MFGVWRQKGLRLNAAAAVVAEGAAKDTVLLVETATVAEHLHACIYTEDERDKTAALMLPNKLDWCPLFGKDVETMAVSSKFFHGKEYIRVRFAHFFKQGDSSTCNATLHLSLWSQTIVVIAEQDLKPGDEVIVQVSVDENSYTPIDSLCKELTIAQQSLDTWKTVEIPVKVTEAEAAVHELQQQVSNSLRDFLTTEEVWPRICIVHFLRQQKTWGEEALVQFTDHFSALPTIVQPPPVMTAIDCENAVEVLEIRQQQGIKALENELKQMLEKFNSGS